MLIAGVGFGCLLALSALTFWNQLAFMPSALSEMSSEFYRLASLGFSVSFAIVVLLYLIVPAYLSRILFSGTVSLLLVGFLLSGYSLGASLSLPEVVLSLGGIFIGLGCGFGMVCWMTVFASFKLKKACGILISGSVFSTIPTLTVFFIALNAPQAFINLISVLLLLSIVFLVLSMRNEIMSLDPNENLVSDSKRGAISQIVRGFGIAIPCIIVLSLFQPLIDTTYLNTHMSVYSKTITSQLGNIAGALAILLVWKLGDWETNVSKIFVWITPIFATACLFFPFIPEEHWYIFSFLSMMVFALLSIAVMVSCLQFSQTKQMSIIAVYGLMACFLYLSGLCGSLFGSFIDDAVLSSRATVIASILTIAFICVFLAMKIWRNLTKGKQASKVKVKESSTEATANPLKLACESIVEAQTLSKREGEVMTLLAHGRDVPFIATSLNLSRHTIRGYIKSIYQNLDVHSKQELIDFVESWNEQPNI